MVGSGLVEANCAVLSYRAITGSSIHEGLRELRTTVSVGIPSAGILVNVCWW